MAATTLLGAIVLATSAISEARTGIPAAAGNGKHYRDCPTFEVDPVVGTPEQLAELKVCSKCDRGIDAAAQFSICPVHHIALPASGICDEPH
ncbi:MAG: hypothetical protein NTX29_15145 [Actinobacteria bacterium]|nr:hypothetical protein [Actinomycetota bacterium]